MQKQRRSHAIQKLLSDYPFNSCLSYPTREIQEIDKRHAESINFINDFYQYIDFKFLDPSTYKADLMQKSVKLRTQMADKGESEDKHVPFTQKNIN